jgi:hypothetical protein
MSETLNLDPNIRDADGFYEALINTHQGLSEEESEHLNARLILILANHIGDRRILDQALEVARESS